MNPLPRARMGLSLDWGAEYALDLAAYTTKVPLRLMDYADKRLPLVVYEKDTVSVETLLEMRRIAGERGWWLKDTSGSVQAIEEFFYFAEYRRNWEFVSPPKLNLDEQGP